MPIDFDQLAALVAGATDDHLEDDLAIGRAIRELRSEQPGLSPVAIAASLRVSPSRLYRWLRTLELCDRVGTRYDHLKPSHFRAVFHVSPALQEQLLRRADAGRWTVRRLQQEAAGSASAAPSRGRPREVPLVRTLRRVCLIAAEPEAFHGVELLADLSGTELRRMLEGLEALQAGLRGVEGVLRREVALRSWGSPAKGAHRIGADRALGVR